MSAAPAMTINRVEILKFITMPPRLASHYLAARGLIQNDKLKMKVLVM
ncbi:hypothetical protein [Agrobacterium vitis]|nr:hypothetical protein [Agrobacterium vitis]